MSRVGRLSAILLVTLVLSMVSVAQASPPSQGVSLSFLVNDNSDLPDLEINGLCEAVAGTGACTVRAALDEINAAGGGLHHVTIPPMVIPLSLQYGRLLVKPGVKVAVLGLGVGRTVIDGGGPAGGVGIFGVAAGGTLRVRGLSLTNGRDSCCGAGILNAGNVYISHSLLSGHHATASGEFGDPGQGAAIFNQPGGLVTLANSTIMNNQSRGSGGGIRNEGHLAVMDSTFSGNDGAFGGGGALANVGSAYIFTSTFSGNHSAGAGAIWNTNTGRVYIYSATFAHNFTHTGGPSMTLQNQGMLALSNTIVYAAPGGTNCDGAMTSFGFNLSNDASCNLRRLGDRQGADPKLAPLANNGGPTPTHRLLLGSAALDKGLCWGTDQRGFRRPLNIPLVPNFGNACDIGAFEVQLGE